MITDAKLWVENQWDSAVHPTTRENVVKAIQCDVIEFCRELAKTKISKLEYSMALDLLLVQIGNYKPYERQNEQQSGWQQSQCDGNLPGMAGQTMAPHRPT